MTLELSFCFIITGNRNDDVVNNSACNGRYTFIQFIASAVCHRNPLTTGRYFGIKTTKRQFLTLCEVEVYSRGNGLIIYCIALRLRENGRNNSQRCCSNNVGSCCVRVGSGVQTDATTRSNVGTSSASWEGYNPQVFVNHA